MRRLRRPSSFISLFLFVALLAAGCSAAADVSTPAVGPGILAAVVPPQGATGTLDVANWNVEWFGAPSFGPTDDALQLSNVRDVIQGADLDVWALEEVVDATEWGQLKAQLPGYAGVLSNEPAVSGGSGSYTATEQKLALLWKSSLASLLAAKVILTAQDFAFAGRPPLEVVLRVSLNGTTEDVVFIVLHMKAFNDAASWQRRLDAANALKSYLDATYPTQKVYVIGDWNDDLDVSITPGKPTPFAQFNNDPARYTWPTRALTDAGVSSTTSFPDFVDHQLHTNEVNPMYRAGSATAFRADSYVPDYATTTSDHFPVYSRYDWGAAPPPPPPPPPPGGSAQVIINEIMANEPGSSTAGEYVELVNVGGSDAQIGGWTIRDGTAMRHSFAANTVLSAGKAIVVFAGAAAIPPGLANAVAASTGSLSLANAGDQVIVRDAAATTIDSFTYTSSLAGTDGVSMNRNPDASATGTFVLHTAVSSLKGSAGKRADGSAF